MVMRNIFGNVVLPSEAPSVIVRLVLVELHDVSLIDAPSIVISVQQLSDIPIYPSVKLPFSIITSEVISGRSLSLRAHVDIAGDGIVSSGDLVTTISYPVNCTGDQGPFELMVQVV